MNIKQIIQVVCEEYGLESWEIQRRTRKRYIREPRQVIHYFANKLTKMSLYGIGEEAGKLTHATVLNSIKVVQNYIDTDKEFSVNMDRLRDCIKNYYLRLKNMNTYQDRKEYYLKSINS